jgi:hypothetical protein
VSFVVSIPLGYLNVIGFEIYSKLGVSNLILFYWVLFLEMFVILFHVDFRKTIG